MAKYFHTYADIGEHFLNRGWSSDIPIVDFIRGRTFSERVAGEVLFAALLQNMPRTRSLRGLETEIKTQGHVIDELLHVTKAIADSLDRLTAKVTGQQPSSPVLKEPIGFLDLSVRSRKCLLRKHINTVGDLVRYSRDDLLEVKNFGVSSAQEVDDQLAEHGLKLKEVS